MNAKHGSRKRNKQHDAIKSGFSSIAIQYASHKNHPDEFYVGSSIPIFEIVRNLPKGSYVVRHEPRIKRGLQEVRSMCSI